MTSQISVTPDQLAQIELLHKAAAARVLASPTKYVLASATVFGLLVAPLGAMAAGAIALPFLYGAIKRALHNGANAAYLRETGLFAHLLNERELIKFTHLVGKDVAIAHLIEARDDGKYLSNAALDYLEYSGVDTAPKDLKTVLQEFTAPTSAALPVSPESPIGSTTKLTAIDVPATEQLAVGDIARYLAQQLHPLIITAKPRTGKGIIVSQALRYAREFHPGLSIWLIQPKPHPSESGYWEGCDRQWAHMIENHPVNDSALVASLSQFVMEWRAQESRPTLLVIDELVKLEACLPKWYREFIPALMKVESSSGETDHRYLWTITQSPQVKDLGLSGGNRCAFDLLALEKVDSKDHYTAIKASYTGIAEMPPDSAIAATPKGIVAYHNRINRWVGVVEYSVPAPLATVPTATLDPSSEPDEQPEGIRPDLPLTEIFLYCGELAEWIQATGIKNCREIYEKWKSRKHGFTRPEIRYLLSLIDHA